MAEIEKKPVKIVETILRDAHQSLIATRMTTDQMMPIVDKMDKVGYHAVECWGGATFDASLRFLKEDPWERLRKFRDGFKNTKRQMLFRGAEHEDAVQRDQQCLFSWREETPLPGLYLRNGRRSVCAGFSSGQPMVNVATGITSTLTAMLRRQVRSST